MFVEKPIPRRYQLCGRGSIAPPQLASEVLTWKMPPAVSSPAAFEPT
jgi:hypothetical protein